MKKKKMKGTNIRWNCEGAKLDCTEFNRVTEKERKRAAGSGLTVTYEFS